MKKVTQQEIADNLGISRLTVSKALNGSSGIHDEMKQLVLQKAYELGYIKKGLDLQKIANVYDNDPGDQVVSLFTFEGGHIGIYWGQVINGVASGLVRHGVDLNLCLVRKYDETSFETPANFNPKRSKGIITLGNFNKNHIKKMKAFGLPLVSIDTIREANDYRLITDTVMMCNEQPVTEITTSLIRNGHKEIGYVGEVASCRSFRERWLGFKRGMKKYNLEIDESLCCLHYKSSTMTPEIIQKAVGELPKLPTAFVCANDFTALNVIQALQKLGKVVPGDIAISGFDNTFESDFLNITTVDCYKVELGERAADELFLRISNPRYPFVSVRMMTKVIFRESTNKIIAMGVSESTQNNNRSVNDVEKDIK
ncbi:MAG: LacI family DNA-binding transcriptional regulator [Anaerocolumna sp.]